MGFHKRYLPELSILKRQYEEMDREQFVRLYTKPDSVIGPVDSFDFLQEVLKKHFNQMTSRNTGKKE